MPPKDFLNDNLPEDDSTLLESLQNNNLALN